MKLVDLLEQGKKARVEDFVYDYIYFNKGNNCILTDRNEVYAFGLDDLTRNDWYEYEKYKTNFEFGYNQRCYCIGEEGNVSDVIYRESNSDKAFMVNFNQFPNKELAEFIQKKQLLDRQLTTFSYLNGGGIEWDCIDENYYIDVFYDFDNDLIVTEIAKNKTYKVNSRIYFKTKEIAEKALELYGNDMEELLKMSIKLGF